MNPRRLAWWFAVALVAAIGGGWIVLTRAPEPVETAAAAHVHFRAPEFDRPRLDGAEIALGDLRGRVVLVNFWATWCLPCRAEIPELQTAYQAHQAQGFTVLAINAGEDRHEVASFVDRFQIGFPILLDADGSVQRLYQVQALPTSLLIDRTGIVRATHTGALSRAYLETELAPLLEADRR